MSVPPEDIDRVTRLLRAYFENDRLKRFELERYVSGGANALTWKIKYKPTPTAKLERIVLKMERFVAFFDEEDTPAESSAPTTPLNTGIPTPSTGDSRMDIDSKDDDDDDDFSGVDMWTNPIKNEKKWLRVRETALLITPGDGIR